MHGNPLEIEQIVRMVLDRLRSGSVVPMRAAHQAPPNSLSHSALQTAEPSPPVGTMRLDTKLVTLRSVEDKLDGLQILQVPLQAVVTPSVLDELRYRKIRLERRALPPVASHQSVDRRLMLVLDTPRDGLNAHAAQVCTGTQDCSKAAGRIATHITGGGQIAIWAADRPFAAALACAKIASLRGIQLSRIADLARAQSEADPNVIIVDGLNWDVARIRELMENLIGNLKSGAAR